MLKFTPITIEAIETLKGFAARALTHSCDYTPGNLVMWAEYMHYEYAVESDTLFIRSLSELDLATPAFLPPIGSLPLKESIALLQEYCHHNNTPLHITAVPEDMAHEMATLLPSHNVKELDGWADYIHSAEDIATLQGKALNKRRNRKKKFLADYPHYTYKRCTTDDIPAVVEFLLGKGCDEAIMRCYEVYQSIATVRNLPIHPQPAGIIKIDDKVVAFTLGEAWGDMLYIHIEKADREYAGLGETLTSEFAADIISEMPQIKLINREEDLGNEGLRQAKRAYNPIAMLNRYEFTPAK